MIAFKIRMRRSPTISDGFRRRLYQTLSIFLSKTSRKTALDSPRPVESVHQWSRAPPF
jgi:hypothetical protein